MTNRASPVSCKAKSVWQAVLSCSPSPRTRAQFVGSGVIVWRRHLDSKWVRKVMPEACISSRCSSSGYPSASACPQTPPREQPGSLPLHCPQLPLGKQLGPRGGAAMHTSSGQGLLPLPSWKVPFLDWPKPESGREW